MNPEEPNKEEFTQRVPVEVVEDETVPVGFVRFHGRLVPMAQAQREVEKLRRRRERLGKPVSIELDDVFVPHVSPGGGRRKQAEIRKRASKRKRNRRRR